MMDSAPQNAQRRFPLSVQIDASEAFTENKLKLLFLRDPTMEASVDGLKLDDRRIGPGDRIPNVLAGGGEGSHLIEPGFSIHIADGEAAHDWSITARSLENCIRLRFAAHGDAQYRAGDASVVDENSSCTFMIQPAGVGLTGTYRRGVRYRYCSIHMSQSFLVERLGIAEKQLPAVATDAWEKHEVAFGRIELERSTLGVIQRLLSLRSDLVWDRLQAQGIGLLVIAQIFSAWRDQRQPSTVLVRLKPSERTALGHLHREAERRCPELITIGEAEAITGLNRNKVHYGFKEMFGTSLQRHCMELRMRHAANLIRTSALTIAEIAEQSGYSEPTNFTAAFNRHFGELPSAFRKSA